MRDFNKIMIYLGVDYGTKRIGLAKADGETRIATPLRTIANEEDTLSIFKKIVAEEGVDEIVVGLPVSFDGKENTFAQKIREFGDKLKKAVVKPVHLQNEVLSSTQAEKSESRDVDSSAAALILQSFIDSTPK